MSPFVWNHMWPPPSLPEDAFPVLLLKDLVAKAGEIVWLYRINNERHYRAADSSGKQISETYCDDNDIDNHYYFERINYDEESP